MPVATVSPAWFKTKAEALTELARDDLWPLTVHQGAFPMAPLHYHDASVRIYVIAGSLWVYPGHLLPRILAEAGARIDFPAGAVHSVSSDATSVTTLVGFTSPEHVSHLPQHPAQTG